MWTLIIVGLIAGVVGLLVGLQLGFNSGQRHVLGYTEAELDGICRKVREINALRQESQQQS